MKIRIQITAADQALAFEHSGPVIRMGRDPGCELYLQGKASDTVSRWHAQIDLTDQGATLTDTQSSNGTFLNDREVKQSTALRVGDRIQLGLTGAQLEILELDLTPVPVAAFPPLPRSLLLGGGAVLVVVVLAVGLWFAFKGSGDHSLVLGTSPETAHWVPPTANPEQGDVSLKMGNRPPRADTGSVAQPETGKTPEGKPVPPIDKEKKEPDVVGKYLTRKEDPEKKVGEKELVSVLLQRRTEINPWSVLWPGNEVRTDHTLVSLPGYQSVLALECKINLTLWGTLPEWNWGGLPVLESVVILQDREAGFDLSFILDRGRVQLANVKENNQEARIRLRFLRQEWDLTLSSQGEVVLDLCGLPFWSTDRPGKSEPRPCLDLTVKSGSVQVQLPQQYLNLKELSHLRWEYPGNSRPRVDQLPKSPPWWSLSNMKKEIENSPMKEEDKKAFAGAFTKAQTSLMDWSNILGGSFKDNTSGTEKLDTVVSTVKAQVEVGKDSDNQDVGVLFLAALDAIEPLVVLLRDTRYPHVRGVARFALQSWLGRDPGHGNRLVKLLKVLEGSEEVAQTIVRLLHFYPPTALENPETYKELIGFLTHPNPVVRDLAFWHLVRLGASGRLPEEAKGMAYDPNGKPEEWAATAALLKKLLEEGKLPKARPGPR